MRLTVFVGYHYWGLATSANKEQGAMGQDGLSVREPSPKGEYWRDAFVSGGIIEDITAGRAD
jgi:hypothetical protein